MRSRFAILAVVVIGSLAGVLVGAWLLDGYRAPAAPTPSPVSTATIVRGNLQTTMLTGGTLGYQPGEPVVNQRAGIYTALPPMGTTIVPGGTLYRVNDLPVTLMRGATPAWRAFELGMSDGPDVAELQANLIVLRCARGLFSAPDGHYGWLTASAVERWQQRRHELVTGAIVLGDIDFLPAPVRVGTQNSAPGQSAAPGQSPYQASTTARAVTIPISPNLPPVAVGEGVSITLPAGTITPGTISAIGTGQITVRPSRPAQTGTGAGVAVQVSLTTSSARDVLVAPVSALLALAGGGYGVQVVQPPGPGRLVAVQTGLFAGGQVQVTGQGIHAGTRIVVAQ